MGVLIILVDYNYVEKCTSITSFYENNYFYT